MIGAQVVAHCRNILTSTYTLISESIFFLLYFWQTNYMKFGENYINYQSIKTKKEYLTTKILIFQVRVQLLIFMVFYLFLIQKCSLFFQFFQFSI